MFATSKFLLMEIATLSVPQPIPIIIVRDGDDVHISFEALTWALEMLGLGAGGPATFRVGAVGSKMKIIARFFNFVGLAYDGKTLLPGEIDFALSAFATCRHSGTHTSDASSAFWGLDWSPAASTTVRSEYRQVADFLEFCVERFGYVWPLTDENSTGEFSFPINRMRSLQRATDKDFFVQLAARRDYWTYSRGSADLQLPSIRREPHQTHPRAVQAPSSSTVWELIKAERNTAFQAIWVAAAFGGPRISEQLNSWQQDHRPGADRSLFFPTVALDHSPLYLRVHPTKSRYIRHPQHREETRREHLAARYGELARTERVDELAAGWKGTVAYGSKDTHMVMWSDLAAANLFGRLADEIHDFLRHYRVSARHPWFFVNMGATAGDALGEPITMSRIEAAFEAACRRIGARPYRWGLSIHGLRHFYKGQLKKVLGVDPLTIQVAMGHSSPKSQEDYDRHVADAHSVIGSVMRTINA